MALPAVIAGVLLRKKVILRIGGDFIYENFLFKKELNILDFYQNFPSYKKQMGWSLYVKYSVQKFVLENCYGIVFNTDGWQEKIYRTHYRLPKHIWNIPNPVDKVEMSRLDRVNLSSENKKKIFVAITRDIPYKNISRLKRVFGELNNQDIILETKQRSHAEVLDTLANAFAYLNVSHSEISPNQVLEAVQFQLPIIITKYSGITDYLVNSGVAVAVEPTNEQDIKEKIKYILNLENYQRIKDAYKNFIWPQTWNSLFKQYESIVDGVCTKN